MYNNLICESPKSSGENFDIKNVKRSILVEVPRLKIYEIHWDKPEKIEKKKKIKKGKKKAVKSKKKK